MLMLALKQYFVMKLFIIKGKVCCHLVVQEYVFDSYMCFPYILHVCNTLSDEALQCKSIELDKYIRASRNVQS